MKIRAIIMGGVLALAAHPAFAAGGLATPFSWQTSWGNILPSSVIPTERHNIKNDISDTVHLCGVAANYYSAIASYKIDFTGDGNPDFIIDESAYFKQGQKSSCDTQICTSEGCQMALYAYANPTQVMASDPRSIMTVTSTYAVTSTPTTADATATGSSTPVAPVTTIMSTTSTVAVACPVPNTGCRTDCAATTSACPSLFNYNMPIAWVGIQNGWSFISLADYNAYRLSADDAASDDKTPRHREAYNTNPVFKVVTSLDQCTVEELLTPVTRKYYKDGRPLQDIVGLTCVKFFQYAGSSMRDLYNPQALDSTDTGDETDSRMALQDSSVLTRVLSADKSDYLVKDPDTGNYRSARELFKRSTSIVENSSTIDPATGKPVNTWRAAGAKFFAGTGSGTTSKLAIQIKAFDTGATTADSHVLSVTNPSSGVVTPLLCEVFTAVNTPSLFVPTKTDAEFQSFRQAVKNGTVAGLTVEACVPKYTAWSGNTVCPVMSCGTIKKIAAERECIRPTGSYASCTECKDVTDTTVITDPHDASRKSTHLCFFDQLCYNTRCPTYHHSCLAGDTMVLMADGTQKAIKDVKAGDEVMSFKQKAPLAGLKAAKVKAVMVTEGQAVVTLDGLKITPNHLLALANGKLIEAGQVHPGTQLVGLSGEVVTVGQVDVSDAPITVYNFDVEGADGYVANGIRVQSYPEPTK